MNSRFASLKNPGWQAQNATTGMKYAEHTHCAATKHSPQIRNGPGSLCAQYMTRLTPAKRSLC
ncbi:hypothetical protein TMES_18330 [Thalassospira mesophila]|uniref:Uncharacterized protein n=1 Tax=Thalassospira mesophila TaxID=1293891 RepID=A0A1Y2KWE3_9PROT|nr:hypothetical protein TMES_18330 [Thalassospira mesophila]